MSSLYNGKLRASKWVRSTFAAAIAMGCVFSATLLLAQSNPTSVYLQTPPLTTTATTSVTSPVHFQATEEAASTITGYAIYVDNNLVYLNSLTTLDAWVVISSGTHNVHITAWDCGTCYLTIPSQSGNYSIDVTGFAPPTPPASALNLNVDKTYSWAKQTGRAHHATAERSSRRGQAVPIRIRPTRRTRPAASTSTNRMRAARATRTTLCLPGRTIPMQAMRSPTSCGTSGFTCRHRPIPTISRRWNRICLWRSRWRMAMCTSSCSDRNATTTERRRARGMTLGNSHIRKATSGLTLPVTLVNLRDLNRAQCSTLPKESGITRLTIISE